MSGFNLPPGCSVNDIPGNRPEDAAEEALCEMIDAAIIDGLSDEQREAQFKLMRDFAGKIWLQAYNQGGCDAAEALTWEKHAEQEKRMWEEMEREGESTR